MLVLNLHLQSSEFSDIAVVLDSSQSIFSNKDQLSQSYGSESDELFVQTSISNNIFFNLAFSNA